MVKRGDTVEVRLPDGRRIRGIISTVEQTTLEKKYHVTSGSLIVRVGENQLKVIYSPNG